MKTLFFVVLGWLGTGIVVLTLVETRSYFFRRHHNLPQETLFSKIPNSRLLLCYALSTLFWPANLLFHKYWLQEELNKSLGVTDFSNLP